MAKRRKKSGWFTRLVFSVMFILLVWLLAFLVWLIWPDLEKLVDLVWKKEVTEQTQKSSQEKILEEDRKKLEEILKQRQ